jgi:hypothetical protein
MEQLLEFLIENMHWVIIPIHSCCLLIQRAITSHQRPLTTIFDILSLKRLLPHMLILRSGVQNLSLIDDSRFFFYTQKYEQLLVQCLPYLSQNALRLLNLICTKRILWPLSSVTLTFTGTSCSTYRISCSLSIVYIAPKE